MFFVGSQQQRSEDQLLTIILNDINDQFPIIQTTHITASEQSEEVSILFLSTYIVFS